MIEIGHDFLVNNLQDDALLSAYYNIHDIKIIDLHLACFYRSNIAIANAKTALHNSIHHNPRTTLQSFKSLLLTTIVN